MNRTKLKTYAPQARRDFIQAVTDRAAFYGLTDKKIEPITENGDVAIIGGRAFPRAVANKRKALEERIAQYGFVQTIEAIAYTWFNRLVAIRYMELHGYFDHGYRVLSHPDASKSVPEILEQAEHLDLPGLDKHKVIELKLEGSKEAELYRMLLLAQCNALHRTMPFLFEWIGDETELLLPDNLLHTDSLIRKLVGEIDESDWQEVEIIGWLYQFYIAERKDEVMARKSAVPTEDIPAVTQLFTPHWIVRYLVENSLGRLWLLNRPGSRLRQHMPYYIEGEAETDFLKITKPEDIRLLDPACGSGHMLTYAFDLLFLIYEEEGYVPNEIPALILKHNLYGLEICPRAAQLAELALVFKARGKSHRFFQPGTLVQPHILALQDIRFDEGELRDYIAALDLGDLFNQPMLQLLHQFKEATTFGSLIQPCLDEENITFSRSAIEAKDLGGKLFLRETHGKVLRVLEQAEMLCQRYHVVVANPPYMGSGQMNAKVKQFAKDTYFDSKSDCFAMFIEQGFNLIMGGGYNAMVTMESWMFLSSYERFRARLLAERTIISGLHMPYLGKGGTSMGINFGTIAAVFASCSSPNYQGHFSCVRYFETDDNGVPREFPVRNERLRTKSANDFGRIPSRPIAYWLSKRMVDIFASSKSIKDLFSVNPGMRTGKDELFLRLWFEVSNHDIQFGLTDATEMSPEIRWFPLNKGGVFRKWYGNSEHVVNLYNDAIDIKTKSPDFRLRDKCWYFKPYVTWSRVTSSDVAFRLITNGVLFSDAGPGIFAESRCVEVAKLLNSKLGNHFLAAINPTLNYQKQDIESVPFIAIERDLSDDELVVIARHDWDNFETSWDFRDQPLLRPGLKGATLEASWRNWEAQSTAAIHRMQELETQNNRIWIEAYALQGELSPEVPDNEITLARPSRRKDMAAFLSYAVGCMMGRYSLDKPGLILVNVGDSLAEYLAKVGQPFDTLKFAPDEDGIIPVLDGEWFEDDIAVRTQNFLRATFGGATLEANLHFIEESLGKDLRKYFLTDFYKDHLQTYKKRPIYWLFSSGKERAFQCLVYLHRYQDGTLARMRTEYVIPLQGKMAARIEQLASETQKAPSTSQRKTLEKERDKLLKHQTELRAFDEKLRHYADQRITLDLDDGVKVNYGKFGDLLAEVKAVAGGTDED
ncbi:MAG: BREX-1 system adenine-specific DNA-methyltransferase PglX [Nitrospiraceae bacterium]|nr:BREX-1 system adenine-specific DNA-methyltransferase PglX [Nitrospiraceae bacterium]